MKIAIVCDWLVTFAGAEKFLSEILKVLPEADLFAVIDFLSEENKSFLNHKKIHTTFIQRLPFAKTKYRNYLPLMPLAIEQLDLSGYDLIISNCHAVAKGVLTGPNQIHISFALSPMRYAWDLQHQYLKESGLTRGIKSYFVKYLLHRLRLWDQRTANGVDHFISISNYIARRVWKTYRRESTVIYPPVDIEKFTPCFEKEDYYVAASRMVPYKKMDLIVESFAKMPDKKLIVIGDGPDFKKVSSKATRNIEVLGFQDNETLSRYIQRAKAFVFAAEEDYGLLPLEAQASGTPVIAYGKGGATETVRNITETNPTGIYFENQTTDAMIQAVRDFELNQHDIKSQHCIDNARRFDRDTFQTQFKKFLHDKLNG